MKQLVNTLCNKLNTEWALLSAGDKNDFNAMTISWGSFGVLWFKNTATVYVRPTRHTLKFLKNCSHFTISFYDEKHKKDLQILGTKSGKDTNKMKEVSLTPKFLKNSVTFEEATQTFVCKKLLLQQIDFNGLTDEIKTEVYPDKNCHIMIVGEIENII